MMRKPPIITLDVDWAPDFAITWCADLLRDAGVKATWFITHTSPAVAELGETPELFELGLHPNFLPSSTHGESLEAILEHMLEIVRQPRSMRTHSLVQSSPLLATVMRLTPVAIDVSLLVPRGPVPRPFSYTIGGRQLTRVPYIWEDDIEMEQTDPVWHLADLRDGGDVAAVMDFHPIHAYLNHTDPVAYEYLKGVGPIQSTHLAAANELRRTGPGPGAVLQEAVEACRATGGGQTIADLVEAEPRLG